MICLSPSLFCFPCSISIVGFLEQFLLVAALHAPPSPRVFVCLFFLLKQVFFVLIWAWAWAWALGLFIMAWLPCLCLLFLLKQVFFVLIWASFVVDIWVDEWNLQVLNVFWVFVDPLSNNRLYVKFDRFVALGSVSFCCLRVRFSPVQNVTDLDKKKLSTDS